jgi:hypothetical protein
MMEMIKNKATICIVNYKTLDFIRLCLRSIRRFTTYPYEVIVVDNNSQDESVEYLRGLKWIRLIERDTEGDHGGGYSHGAALQLGRENCNTEFFVSLYFEGNEQIACVGSDKIELSPQWRIWVKKATDIKTFKRKLLREPDPHGKYRYYNRTICCLYRTSVLAQESLSFLPDSEKGITSGKGLYFSLVDRGYKTVELPPKVMAQYVVHLAHATQVVNPQEFTLRGKTVRKCNRQIKKLMTSDVVRDILGDSSLDR